jgi:undecaprenyl diphosphate synthase
MHNENLPTHIAIIPDGNRHWARERGLKPWEGHEAGAKVTEKIVRAAFKIKIKYLSFWGSSIKNLEKRSLQERKHLLSIYERYLKKLMNSEDVHRNEARINVIGEWEKLVPEKLKKVIRECTRKTSGYNKYFLNFFLAYSGDNEMVEAVKNIVKSKIPAEKITGQTIKDNLLTHNLPPVDLLIRTGGEPHLSVGFMMWDIADAQLYFPAPNYPDFGLEGFEEAIKEYQRRERRHGK